MALLATAVCALVAAPAAAAASGSARAASLPASNSSAGFAVRAFAELERLVTCDYLPLVGAFVGEAEWQSGNTLETLSLGMLALARSGPSAAPGRLATWAGVLNNSYHVTGDIVDQCFDDHQWWGLAWVRAYEATGVLAYLQRAAVVFDYTAANGWTPQYCGGGVDWCPVNGTAPYKNAITSELFLTSAMALYPHAAALGRDASYYLGWAATIWDWLAGSGMQNGAGLFNDGLNAGAVCTNNGGTTWTYNQGVALSGLGWLAAATGNASIAAAADALLAAAAAQLTIDGILVEPCSGVCDGDQQLFKGIWARHVAYLAGTQASAATVAAPFLTANAASLLATATCGSGDGYGLRWDAPCDTQTSATSSAGTDLLLAASAVGAPAPMAWQPLGLGNCADAAGAAMPNCYAQGVSEAACRDYAYADARAVAYDIEFDCVGTSFCRVRTLSTSCGGGFTYEGGSATNVTATDGSPMAVCVVRTGSG
jgi:predicted alpha-1,6-mannanase (GH76 family)